MNTQQEEYPTQKQESLTSMRIENEPTEVDLDGLIKDKNQRYVAALNGVWLTRSAVMVGVLLLLPVREIPTRAVFVLLFAAALVFALDWYNTSLRREYAARVLL